MEFETNPEYWIILNFNFEIKFEKKMKYIMKQNLQ